MNCICGHDIELHDPAGCHGFELSKGTERTFCLCALRRYDALKASVEATEARTTNAEARVAGLLQSVRELSGSNSTLRTERDTAWTELRVIRKTIGADENEATSDEVVRLFGKLTAERDELLRKLEQAQKLLESIERIHSEAFNSGDGVYRP